MMLTVLVRGDREVRRKAPAPLRRALQRRVERAMRAAGLTEQAEVCLSLTDDAEVHELNRAYAQEDHPTDVLSFSQGGAGGLPGAAQVLGDVVISVETAERQAQAAGHDLLAELLHLSVHGLCHLLGYDHATPDEERVMFGYEALLREQALGAGSVRAPQRPPV